jgi:hypothetical protein
MWLDQDPRKNLQNVQGILMEEGPIKTTYRQNSLFGEAGVNQALAQNQQSILAHFYVNSLHKVE